jgi:nucleoid DNA-binding protein
MDKPMSLSVKDYLVRKLAVKLMVSEKVIDAVVSHQFSSANEALASNKTVEISGFGKFIFNQKKAEKKMAKYVAMKEALERKVTIPEHDTNLNRLKLESVSQAVESLKPKMNGFFQDLRGVEEQSVPTLSN